MRTTTSIFVLCVVLALPAAEVESRVLTHYLPQDLLETVVRTEGWTELTLNVKGGFRKGDVVRIWAGGSIDRGNGDQPGENVNGPAGLRARRFEIERSHQEAKRILAMLTAQKTDGDELLRMRDLVDKFDDLERNLIYLPSELLALQNELKVARAVAARKENFALSANVDNSFALLFKTEGPDLHKCLPPGKPLEIKLTKDKERVWIGFNDEPGRYHDNHLGKGRRHELEPLWIRIEVVRIIVD